MSAQEKNAALLEAAFSKTEETEKVILLLEARADIETRDEVGVCTCMLSLHLHIQL